MITMSNQQQLTETGVHLDIGISIENREAVARILSRLLADEHVLYVKTRNYHWNVMGMQFQQLHQVFSDQYTQLAEFTDDVAERIRSLGFFAPGSMENFQQLTRLAESDHVSGNAVQMIENLLQDHESVIQFLRRDLEKVQNDYHDVGTADFLTGLMEAHEKTAWMLRAHLG